ncbi:MAG: hypothetical protein ACOYL6_15660 [Bacteriovoracaceae bacterium]
MKTIIVLLTLLILSACVPDSGGGGTKKSSLIANGSAIPTVTATAAPLPQASNFLQQGTTKTTSILALPVGFNDSFLARGNQVNAYLNGTTHTSTIVCLVMNFSTNPDNKVGVFAAIPLYYNNFTTSSREYYYQLQPAEKTINQVNCQTSGLVNSLLTAYAGKTPVFSLAEICPSCSQPITSEGLKLFSSNGVSIADTDLSGLRLQVGGNVNSSNSGGTCTSSSNCVSLGYDCCLSNQCVLDGRTKDNMSVPASVLTEIAANPASFKNYPEYYYICPINIPTPTPTPDTSNSQEIEAALRLEHLKDLYDCTKTNEDELNICTIAFNNVKNDIVNSGSTGFSFSAAIDDLNFTTINNSMAPNNITEVSYAGTILYQLSSNTNLTSRFSFLTGSDNDNLVAGQTILVKGAPAALAPHDYLKIKYKVDGSCERLSNQLARCKKYYIQGQSSSPAKVSDHSGGFSFKVPTYFDSNYVVNVKVNDIVIPSGATTWNLTSNNVVFANSNPVLNGQKVVITYYVSGLSATNVISSHYAALTEINSVCANSGNNSCGNGNCTLLPVTQNNGGVTSVVDYSCVYPQPDVPEPPMQQTVYVSAKSVPHRYFDQSGVYQDTINPTTLPQEGLAFSYTNNNLVKPANLTSYVGINEIFGSFKNSDPTGAQAAKTVVLKKGRQYDIWVETGYYTPCTNCGSDYYSSLQKIFPSNFEYKGGGYKPSITASSRTANLSAYRADDLIFGRACFVPVTMIPWTHMAGSISVQNQRQNRLKAQHFMYANGYSRDWYGFDYGALIGSYDGVTWFAIGNQRRTTASTNKLYLAINGNFGDLTTINSFTVTVSEVSAFTTGGSEVTSDFASDGAECQQFHVCSTDNDCLTKMGYEYSCQNVSTISTNWPAFNANAEEQLGASNIRTIASIVGGLTGGSKRCVYRGRGAPCAQSFDAPLANALYTGSSGNPGLYSCNSNNYCESVSTSRFNNKIARYGKGPASVNSDTANTTDTFGLAAKIIGRPLDFNGTQNVDSTVQAQLANNELKAICIPGREPAVAGSTIVALNKTVPSSRNADKILGIGTTPSGNGPVSSYVNQCSTLDSTNNYYHYQSSYSSLLNSSLVISKMSVAQNIPTNTFALPIASTANIGSQYEIFTPSTGIITKLGLQPNSCLRAPGASCQTEMDCSVSSYISGKINAVPSAEFLTSYGEAELNFFKETLVCSQDKDPVADIATYDLKDNRCCRQTNNKLTVYSQNYNVTNTTQDAKSLALKTSGMPGVDYSITDGARYSRQAPAYDDATFYPLKGYVFNNPAANIATVLSNQYETLHEINSKTCCSKNWIRSYNTGGHKWQAGKTQAPDKGVLKFLSWNPRADGILPYTCTTGVGTAHLYNTANCEIRNFSPIEEKTYLEWFGLFELTGIPQISIDRNAFTTSTSGSTQGLGGLAMLWSGDGSGTPQYFIPTSAVAESGTKYSANDGNNFNSGIKQIFSDKEFNCCIGTDKTELPDTVTSDMCCTGTKFADEKRCCLPDFTDVSVYLNRYVSSEGAGLSSSAYDANTGYIKDAGATYLLAQAKGGGKSICCSGKMAYGRAIAALRVPGADSKTDKTTRRFAYNNTNTDNDTAQGEPSASFDKGVRWNNHVYCVPDGFPEISN